MNTIKLLLANSSGELTSNLPQITAGFERAKITCSDTLSIDQVDVICTADANAVIPETGIGAFTPNKHLIYLYIDPSQTVAEDEIFFTLCHEMHHAKRYEGPGYGETLFDTIVFEGLAVNYEREVSGRGSFFTDSLGARKDSKELTVKMAQHFDDTNFDYHQWFIYGHSDIYPRWAGYQVGDYLISQYMNSTNKKASELVLEDSSIFRKFARGILG